MPQCSGCVGGVPQPQPQPQPGAASLESLARPGRSGGQVGTARQGTSFSLHVDVAVGLGRERPGTTRLRRRHLRASRCPLAVLLASNGTAKWAYSACSSEGDSPVPCTGMLSEAFTSRRLTGTWSSFGPIEA